MSRPDEDNTMPPAPTDQGEALRANEVVRNGVVLPTTDEFVDANTLPPDENAALVAAHEERVQAGLVALAIEVAKHQPAPHTTRPYHPNKGKLPDDRDWDSLRVVNCHCCGRMLLGPSDEPLRVRAKGLASKNLPRPIGLQFTKRFLSGQELIEVSLFACVRCSKS